MKITIIYDNLPPVNPRLKADWGFAALVELGEERRILFDTGANGKILLNNMRVLGIDPGSIDVVFISHAHHDHTGGLRAFLDLHNAVELWYPPSMSRVADVKKAYPVTRPTQMYPGIYSTGELEGIEQFMAVETSKGLMLIVGCSHPRMETILRTASQFGEVYGIVGGMHGTSPKSLKGLSLICATHCTQQRDAIKRLYPKAFLEGGAGRVIEI